VTLEVEPLIPFFLRIFVTGVDFVLARSTIERIVVPGSKLRTQPAGSASD
jgi:hypothetical protein